MINIKSEIEKIIVDYGRDVIKERRFVYILSDYGILKDLRAERRILMDIIDGGYSELILQHSMESGDPSLRICSYISEMHNRYGYQIKKLMIVFQWLVDSLGMKTLPFDSILRVKSDEEDIEEIVIKGKYTVKDPFSLIPNYRLPDMHLLKNDESFDDVTPVLEHVRSVLADYSIGISEIESYQTPTMVFLTFALASDIRMTKLLYLQDKISDALAPIGCRMLVPIPGTNRIGVEIPKEENTPVSFFPVVPSDSKDRRNTLCCSIGVEPDGSPFSFWLDEMGSVLISGMKSSGKTNCVHSMMLSLMFHCNPCLLKFAIISVNNTSYHAYEDIAQNFLIRSHGGKYIANDVDSISMLLQDVEQEQAFRKDLLIKSASSDIAEYNSKYLSGDLNPDEGFIFLPYIVLVVDEVSELNDIKNANAAISNEIKNGSNCGIIVILATGNRIKRTVMSDEIRKSIRARITFKHENLIMAKAFMDSSASMKLLPYGDFLYQDSSSQTIKRVSNALIDETMKSIIIQYLSTQPKGKADYVLKHSEDFSTSGNISHSLHTDHELLVKAAQLMVLNKRCNEAFLQKELRCSFNTAHTMILKLEEMGVLSKKGGARSVQVNSMEELQNILH